MSFRPKGVKVNDISVEELQRIRKKERNYAKRKKTGNVAYTKKKEDNKEVVENTAQTVFNVSNQLSRPLSSQEKCQIEMDERQRFFLQNYYKYNGNTSAACITTGITRETFNRWLRTCPDLETHINEVTENMLDLAEQQLMSNIASGKENSLFFFLCNKGKHRGWQDIRKMQAPQANNIQINISHPDGRTTGTVEAKVIDNEK